MKTFAVTNGDMVIEANGRPKVLEGFDKINLDIMHVLAHEYDAETDYGNESFSTKIQQAEREAIPGIVNRDVGAAISRLQKKQRKYPKDYFPDEERVTGIKNLIVKQLGYGAWYYLVVSVAAGSMSDVRKAFVIANPTLSKGA